MLKELTKIIPDTAWAREFRVTEKGVILTGSAESASELITILEESLFSLYIYPSCDPTFGIHRVKNAHGNTDYERKVSLDTKERAANAMFAAQSICSSDTLTVFYLISAY